MFSSSRSPSSSIKSAEAEQAEAAGFRKPTGSPCFSFGLKGWELFICCNIFVGWHFTFCFGLKFGDSKLNFVLKCIPKMNKSQKSVTCHRELMKPFFHHSGALRTNGLQFLYNAQIGRRTMIHFSLF